MRILALDPATKTGWAHGSRFSTIASGTWDLSTRRDESTGMKLIRLKSKLKEIQQSGLDLVVFEAARNAAPKMQGALVHQAKLQSVIELWCEETGIPYRGYSPSEIKKFATGKGNANKAEVIKAARERFHVGSAADDNECDAVCLLVLAIDEYDKAEPLVQANGRIVGWTP